MLTHAVNFTQHSLARVHTVRQVPQLRAGRLLRKQFVQDSTHCKLTTLAIIYTTASGTNITKDFKAINLLILLKAQLTYDCKGIPLGIWSNILVVYTAIYSACEYRLIRLPANYSLIKII